MDRNSKKYPGRRLSLPALALLVASGAAPADWAVQPYVGSSLVLDDNIRFSTTNTQSSTGLAAKVGVVISNETDAVKTRVEPGISYRAYAEDADLNSIDQFLKLSTTSLGERSDLGLDLSFINNSTLTSELEDSGITFINKRRSYFSMAPSWRYLLTPLMSVRVNYRFEGSQYEDSGENGLNDYENQSAKVDLERRLSEDSDFVVRGYYQRYKVLELTNKANSLGVELGYKKRFSPRLEGSFFAGGVNTETTVEGKDDTASGGSADMKLSFNGERTRYFVKYGLGEAPSSAGGAYLRNRGSAGVDNKITEKLSWALDLLAQKQETIGDDATQTDRLYYKVSPTIRWRIRRDWSLQARYTFSAEDRTSEGVDTNAQRNQIYVGVEYRKARLTVY